MDSKPVNILNTLQAQPPGALVLACLPPVALPDGPMNAGPVERSWAVDRASLVACGARHQLLVEFYAARDRGLAAR